jgi:hypothetical protein
MDTSDPEINFDVNGVCNHCRRAELLLATVPVDDKTALEEWTRNLKRRNHRKKHGMIMGLSGGIDSSYVALLATRLGLKPLVVHVDAGWNNKEAVANIASVVDKLGLDYESIVIDWNQMRELQVAFLKSGVKNQDIPQDHAFFAALYATARRYKIRDVITGANLATESILPTSWGSDAMDGKFIRSVAKSQGVSNLSTYPLLTLPEHYIRHMAIGRMVIHKPLNLISYNKNAAIEDLKASIGWIEYGGKHRESLFTSWFQHVYMPRRFGIDKRKAHLSSLIISNQLLRSEALKILEAPEFNEVEEYVITKQVARKLGMSDGDLDILMTLPGLQEYEFPNDQWIYSKPVTTLGRNILARRNQILRNINIAR